MYVTTTGIGLVRHGVALAPELVQPGDKVLVSGTVGDHGVAFVAPQQADEALAALREHPFGVAAAIIGDVDSEPAGRVLGRTGFGGHRMIDMLVGDPLPRIC